jgi:uncharacterized protein with PIN domain
MMPELTQRNELFKPITFRCYAGLNDFLPGELRQKRFIYPLKTPVTLGEAIASLRIPLSEVDLALVNGRVRSLSETLHEDDSVTLYPTFEHLDISGLKGTRRPELPATRFVLDAHLGKLARYLRMLGFDCRYRTDFDDEELIEIAAREERILLTRDKLLLKSRRLTHGYYIRATQKHEQLREVVRKFDLYSQFRSFTRCMTCNAELVPKRREEIPDLMPAEREEHTDPFPREILTLYEEFYFCPECRKLFWKGSHFKRMESFIRSLT